ncbi:hypothetical protein DV737_g3146, partial [Chaetothyriales sp. CBS 132003]
MAPDFSPPHGFTVNNSFTKINYRDVYPPIDPKRPELSQKGSVVLITGSSRGIGREGLAQAFALAGAKAIIITARKVESLEETEAIIKQANPSVEVFPVALELTNEAWVKAAFDAIAKKYSTIDVLVNNAAVFEADGQLLGSTDKVGWWSNFEVNVKGTFLITQAFLSQVNPDRSAHIVYLSSAAAFLTLPANSAYSISKLAVIRLAALTAAEYPNVNAMALHPGIVVTKGTNDFFKPYAKDTALLPGAVANWLTSKEASFLRGRYISANWDVAELIARQDEIVHKDLLTTQLSGLDGIVAEVAEVKK